MEEVAIIFGTRPEIIKLKSVIEELEKADVDLCLMHTGQHYDYEMSQIFFEEFKLREPDVYLNVGSGSHGEQTGKALIKIEEQLMKIRPALVLVEGDTNSSLAGALASVKLAIPVGHVEAGCRCFRLYMPEEVNRVLIDHCSELLFAPTNTAYENLKAEGLANRAYKVGSTLTDVCLNILKTFSGENADILKKYNISSKERYALATIHRRENIDNKKILEGIAEALINFPIKIIFPIHPHTQEKLHEYTFFDRMSRAEHLILTSPLGYSYFLYILSRAELVLTDSGGVQEEACIVNTPCLTLRDTTEWPETVKAGKNILTGTQKQNILKYSRLIISDKKYAESMRKRKCPFNPGAGRKITNFILNRRRRPFKRRVLKQET